MMKWNSSLPTKIRVAYANLAPFVGVRTIEGKDILEGFMPEILRAVANWMNLELTFIREPSDKYGDWKNNTWDGMIGMLYRNEVDIILNPILPADEFLEFLYYTNPITIEAYTILSGKVTEEAGLFLYFRVFEKKVWFGVIIALVLVSATTMLLLKTSAPMESHFRCINTMGQCCWDFISYMLKQIPSTKWLRKKNKKIFSILLHLLMVLWVFGISFLLMTTFQSLLVSKLTMKKMNPIVDTLTDLVRSKSVICLAPREIQIEHVLKDSHIAINRQAWQKVDHTMQQVRVFQHDMLGEVETGKYCVIHGHLIIKDRLKNFFQNKGTCNMHLSNNYFYPFSLLMAIRRDAPQDFYNTFNSGITRLVDADITGRWFESALEVSNLCTSYSDNTLKPLGLENIYGVIVLWGAGLFIAMITLLIEITLTKSKDNAGRAEEKTNFG